MMAELHALCLRKSPTIQNWRELLLYVREAKSQIIERISIQSNPKEKMTKFHHVSIDYIQLKSDEKDNLHNKDRL